MSFSSKISSDNHPDFISVATRESIDTESTSASLNASRRVSEPVLEFRDVTGEEVPDSFFYSIFKRMFKSAYKFFSYVSGYFTSCFSRDSFRDITNNSPASQAKEVVPISIDGIVGSVAAQIIEERREHQKIISQYDLHYLEYVEFYQEQEDFLKNYLQYLQDALNDLRQTLEEYHRLKKSSPSKYSAARVDQSRPIDIINGISENLELLKQTPEIAVLIEITRDLLFRDKKEDDKIIQFSAKSLATMIEGQLTYFQMRQIATQSLKREVNELMNDQLELLVSFDPQANHIAKTEFVGRKIAIEKLPKSQELPSIKEIAEHARLSLLSYMSILKARIQEDVNLITQEMENVNVLIRAEVAKNSKRDYEAYRRSQLRYKI